MLYFLSAALSLCIVSSALPSDDQAKSDLPRAEDLLTRVQANYGDPEAGSVRTRQYTGKAWWKGLQGVGTFTGTSDGLLRGRLQVKLEGFGEFEMASDGALVWEDSTMGVVIRDGWDGEALLRRFALPQHPDWRELYTKAETVGIETVGDRACYKLVMTPRTLRAGSPPDGAPAPDVWFVDTETELLRAVDVNGADLEGAPVVVHTELLEWGPADDGRYPHRVEMTVSGFTLVFEFETFEHDVEIPEGFFAPSERVAKAAREHRAGGTPSIVVQRQETRHIASIRVKIKHADMQKTLSVILPELMGQVIASGKTITGQPLVVYHSFDVDGEIDLEGAIPVSEAVAPKGRMKASTLPAGDAVVAWHVGPYDKLGETHENVQAYMKENGLVARGACWEEYWTDPGMEPDSSKWRTRIVWPCAKAD